MTSRHDVLEMFKDITTKMYPNCCKHGLSQIHLFGTGEGGWRGYVYDVDDSYQLWEVDVNDYAVLDVYKWDNQANETKLEVDITPEIGEFLDKVTEYIKSL